MVDDKKFEPIVELSDRNHSRERDIRSETERISNLVKLTIESSTKSMINRKKIVDKPKTEKK